MFQDEKMIKAVLSSQLATVSQQNKKTTAKQKEVVVNTVLFHFTFVVGISWGHLCKARDPV